jgi:nucleoside-diphosphate-sugar epimerase
VLVTGAGGFIGSALCARLAALAAEVHGVGRSPKPSTSAPIRWWQQDLAEVSGVENLLESIRPEIVYHFAGHVFGSRELEMVVPTFQSNLVATVNLLVGLAKRGCRRFVLAGSLEEPVDATHLAVPSSPYAASKWAASAYARMFHSLYQLPVVIPRVFVVYGPGQSDERKVIPYVIRALLRGESAELGSGERPVDWIYIDDVVAGLLQVADTPGLEGKRVDLGSGQTTTVRDVAKRLARSIGAEDRLRLGALPDRPLEQVRMADLAETRRLIGWAPRIDLETGLARTVEWHADQLGNAVR